jgi:hypothetical protein
MCLTRQGICNCDYQNCIAHFIKFKNKVGCDKLAPFFRDSFLVSISVNCLMLFLAFNAISLYSTANIYKIIHGIVL